MQVCGDVIIVILVCLFGGSAGCRACAFHADFPMTKAVPNLCPGCTLYEVLYEVKVYGSRFTC